jgi:hypothetical protein
VVIAQAADSLGRRNRAALGTKLAVNMFAVETPGAESGTKMIVKLLLLAMLVAMIAAGSHFHGPIAARQRKAG